MCYFCQGQRHDYDAYLAAVKKLREQVIDQPSFLANADLADGLRFADSPEWSEPLIVNQVAASIFQNPNPDEGLLLFVLAAWLDLQAPYVRVWNEMLVQTERWLNATAWTNPDADTPRGNFRLTRPHLLKTIADLSSQAHSRSMAAWFAAAVLRIVQENGSKRGNLYRFVSLVCDDLFQAKDTTFTRYMKSGKLPADYMGTHYKRLWMLIMFLRRDEGVIRCLLRRALMGIGGGQEALDYWADDRYFNSLECELPVDARVKESWERLPFVAKPYSSVEAVARNARMLARSVSASPSSFDASLFFR